LNLPVDEYQGEISGSAEKSEDQWNRELKFLRICHFLCLDLGFGIYGMSLRCQKNKGHEN